MAYDLIKISGLPLVTPDSGQDIVVGVGDYAKRINYNAVKADMVGTSPSYTTDTEPYLMRQTAHVGVVGKCALNKLVGGSLGWNQLCNGSSVTVPSGHKYYMKKSGTASIGASTGSAITGLTSGTDMVIDLTAMFGSTIADYVYSLETSTAGAGVAWLSRYIDLGTYHAYDAGSIQSVQATAHVTTGFNAWNEQWELGGISGEDGNNLSANDRIRSKDYIPIIGGASYYFGHIGHTGATFYVCFYDGNKAFVPPRVTYSANTIQTIPSNVRYMRFFLYDAIHSVTRYLQDITINISKPTGTPKNGDYVPYSGHTYPLGSDTLRGIPQLVSNKLQFDGDEKYPDGTIKRKYGSRAYQSGDTSDGATMITDGTTTVYKLATPTTESSTAFQKVQTIDADGTESFTTSSPVPVGHETETPDNILAALGWLGE